MLLEPRSPVRLVECLGRVTSARLARAHLIGGGTGIGSVGLQAIVIPLAILAPHLETVCPVPSQALRKSS